MSENVLILYFLKKESNIKRTFNVPNITFLSNKIKGNGMTLGLTNGTYEKGLSYSHYSNDWYGLTPSGQQNNAVGTSVSTETQGLGTAYGITTDPSKSGMIVEEEYRANFCIRY